MILPTKHLRPQAIVALVASALLGWPSIIAFLLWIQP